MRIASLSFIASVLLLCCLLPGKADVKLPVLICEHMVLQRDIPVHIWGWADEGENVTVIFRGQKVATVAQEGKWQVVLQPLKFGGPFGMSIQGKNTITFSDVLVGDVWISTGQSNMMMMLSMIGDSGKQVIQDSVKYPNIRLFHVLGEFTADTPQQDLPNPATVTSPGWRVNRWCVATPETVKDFSAVSYFFGRRLNAQLKVPIGLLNIVAIRSPEAYLDAATLHADPELEKVAASSFIAVKSYNAIIAPITSYAIRGVIYYQGEMNVGNVPLYERALPALINAWRKYWGEANFPFLFVQLTGYDAQLAQMAATKKETPSYLDMPPWAQAFMAQTGGKSLWAELREAQLHIWQRVPHTAMVVSVDVGDPFDIHPKRKEPVGERLALAARAIAYGEKIEYSGPIYNSYTMKDGKITLRFSHAGKRLHAQGDKLLGFEIAGADGVFVKADAIIKGTAVIVWNAQIPAPVSVRYGWADYPICNLYNDVNLPASPFRVESLVTGK